MTIISFVNFLGDILFALFYFRKKDNSSFSVFRRAAGLVCLLLTIVLYTSGIIPFLGGTLQRFLVRAILLFCFILLSFPIQPISAIYLTIFWSTLQLLVQSFFFAPYTYAVFSGTAVITHMPLMDMLICTLLTLMVKAVFFLTFTKITPMEGVSPVQAPDVAVLAMISSVAIYTRELAIPLTDPSIQMASELSNYFLTLTLALIVALGFMEYTRRARNTQAVLELQRQETDALLASIKSYRENAQEVSALRHDMRNHMISMRLLLNDGKNEEVGEYIDSLLKKGTAVHKQFFTGNDLVDGILSVKFSDEVTAVTDISVKLDLRSAGFISNEDLCVLFGNVIDNALEACAGLKNDQKPWIKISGGVSANLLLLRFENSAGKVPILVNGLPVTVKSDKSLHGFGLRNVESILRKYDGSMNIVQDTPGAFVLTMAIPVSQTVNFP